ncbi:MAG: hypothetical protein A2V88_05595 [Elusimicrobia bacterium RBG_16_66_12]|nr:MAG: hypothetical protein A2V88_05595 [Elusimicrobia bacterium RBG_16_66_12]
MISSFGLMPTLVVLGGGIIVISPMLLALPLFSELINASPQEAQTFLQRHYPGAFDEDSSSSKAGPQLLAPEA